jgi:hypothetical protein
MGSETGAHVKKCLPLLLVRYKFLFIAVLIYCERAHSDVQRDANYAFSDVSRSVTYGVHRHQPVVRQIDRYTRPGSHQERAGQTAVPKNDARSDGTF